MEQENEDAEKEVEFPKEEMNLFPLSNLLSGGKDLGNIFTDVKFMMDKEGNSTEENNTYVEIPTGSNQRLEIGNNTVVRLEYKWAIDDGVELQDGDYARVAIPDAFAKIQGAPTSGNLDNDGVVVGTYEIENSFLKLVFNSELVGKEERKGEAWANLKFNESKLNENANQKIKFEGKINKNFEITAVPGGDTKAISKSGSPNKTKNADYVNWVIDVNTKLEELINGSVEDTIPDGLGVPYDFEIIDLKVGFNGSVTENGTSSITATVFPVNLGATSSAYRIKYKTKILDHSKTGYNNVATLKDGTTEKGTGNFDIGKLELGSTIEKKGSANNGGKNSDKITWTIDVNKAQLSLDNVTVEDKFTETSGHTLNISEIRIYEIDEHGNKQGGNIASNYSSPTGFPVNLGNLANQAIRIEYDTEIIYNEYKHTDNIFKNEATLKVGGILKGDSVTKTVTVGRETLIEKKGVEGTSYGQPYIDWTLHINKAKHGITGATVKDHMGEGLELVEDSIEIYKGDTTEKYTPATIDSTGPNNFKVTLGNISDYYTIKYRTNIIDPNKSLANQAELFGDGLKGDGVGVGPDLGIIKVGTLGPSNTVNNSYTKSKDINTTVDGVAYDGLNHTDKTMSWKITVNAIKEEVTELVITDTFAPEKSMVFLKDSLKIVRKGSPDVILKEDEDYTLTDKKAEGFTLEFIGSHKPLARAQYDIYYKTSFDPDIVLSEAGTLNTTKNYANTATFTGKVKNIANVESTFSATPTENYDINQVVYNGGKKDGTLDRANRTIKWEVYSNPLGQDLKDQEFKITDTIGESIASSTDSKSGQKFDRNSIVVKTFSLNKDGTITPGTEITGFNITYKKPDGTIATNVKEADKFEITFANGIDVPVMVEYKTIIEGISKNNYSNSANIKGKDLEKTFPQNVDYSKHNAFISKEAISATDGKVYTDDEIKWQLKINESLSEIDAGSIITDQLSDGLVYLANSLEIKKSNGDSLVEDTDYTFTIANNKLTITFTNPVTEMYNVTYKTAVTARKGVKIENKASFNGESGSVTGSGDRNYTVQQFSGGTGSGVSRGSVKIVKTDADDNTKKLEGAEFEIYYFLNGTIKQIVKNSSGGETHKTNNNGTIELKGLVLGREYHIKEVKAPNGYVIDNSDVVKKTLTSTSEKDVTLEFKNTKTANAKGNIKFTKKKQNGDFLPGAEFKLYKKSDQNTVVQTVTSDDNGVVEFKDITVGEYVIKESQPPTSYVAHSDIEVNLQVTKNGDTIALDDVINEKIKGNIEIKKVDGNNEPLVGAKFKIYKQTPEGDLGDAFAIGDEDVIATSNESGIATFTDIPYGKYIIKETSAPTGYAASDREIKVSIEQDGVTLKPTDTEPIKNTKVIGDVEIKKYDEDGQSGLAGAVFILEQNGTEKYRGTTNEFGSFVFANVDYGTYTLKEITAPEGYNLTNQEETIVIETKDQPIIIKEFTNSKIRGNIKLKKVGEEGEGLVNAEFSIYKSIDTEFENIIATATSNEDGEVQFENVAYGEYKIKETTAPEGYNLSDKVLDAKIETQGQEIDLTTNEDNTVSNTKIRGHIEILKRVKNTHAPLKDAKIAIYTSGDVLVDEKTTLVDGKVKFENLEYGDYYYKETKAPSGYILDNLKYPFKIEQDGVTIERNLDNIRRPVVPPVDPEKPDPEEPTNPEKPDPEEPTDPEKPDPEKPTDPSGGGSGSGGNKPNPKPDPEKPVEPEKPTPEVPEKPEPEKPTDPIKEETPKDTPKEGEVEVPKESIVKPTTPPKNGTVTIDSDGKWTYTPKPGFVGKDSFVITITHPDGTTEEILVEIDVDDEVPLGTVDPEKPNTNKPDKLVKSEAVTSNANRLPKTGEENQKGFYITGLLLVVLGVFLKRKRTA